jgi:hypothetical protein
LPTNRILVASSHGLGLREVLLNETFSDKLFERYEVDVLSPFNSMKIDEWGIKRHYRIGDSNRIQRFFSSLTHRALATRTRLAFRKFHDDTGWEFVYEALEYYESHTGGGIDRERWDKRSRSPLGALLKQLTRLFPLAYTQASLISKDNYDAIIVTHPLDGEGVIAAQIATRAGLPVICIVTGIDHLFTGGPVMMNPDLLLVWGTEQADQWRDHHAVFTPKLKGTKVVKIGGLAHDRLTSETGTELFNEEYPNVDPSARVVTFAAFSEKAYPGQQKTCDAILKTFKQQGIKGHLVIRVRPGSGDEMWSDYAAAKPGLVTIQIPTGVFFTKWNTDSKMYAANEHHEVSLFGATLRRSDLIVTAGFSTVFLDAFATGTPAVAAVIAPNLGPNSEPSILEETYRLYAKNVKSIALLGLVTSFERLDEKVSQALTPDGRNLLMQECGEIYDLVAGKPDKLAGERAVSAIIDFLD